MEFPFGAAPPGMRAAAGRLAAAAGAAQSHLMLR